MEEQNNSSQQDNPSNNIKSDAFKKVVVFVWDFLKIIIIAAIIVLPIRYFLFQPFIVKGASMVPNFHEGDYLIIDEISYRITDPKRGDVVVLKYPIDEKQRFIKRIIGLPGETIEIKNGKVNITKNENNILLQEEYLPLTLATDGNLRIDLGDGQYFVMGDNRTFSYDSRRWGALSREDIVGKAALRLFPIPSISFITAPSY